MRGALDSSNLTLADYQKYAKASSVPFRRATRKAPASPAPIPSNRWRPAPRTRRTLRIHRLTQALPISKVRVGPGGDMGGGPGGGQGGSGASGGNTSTGNGDSSSNSSGDSGSSSVDGSDSYNSESGSSGNDSSSGNGDSQGGQPGGMRGGMSQAVDYVSEINATVNLAVVGQLILIGLGLTLISALVGIVFVMRYEPLQILADRS